MMPASSGLHGAVAVDDAVGIHARQPGELAGPLHRLHEQRRDFPVPRHGAKAGTSCIQAKARLWSAIARETKP